ncbi:MAG: SDR family NAD(P)-dependent oxidoreductase [Gammaproteobacteria bacterium]
MPRLQAKTAVVTGASSGIGRAIALSFAAEGADVIVNYLNSADAAQRVVAEIQAMGRVSRAIRADVSKQEDVRMLIAQARSLFDKIDVWVNNAGADILTGPGAAGTDPEKLERLLDVDLRGTLYCCWEIAPVMRDQGGGVIINMSWDLAVHGLEGRNPQMFAAVKAGVLGFSRSLARQLAPQIRVNVLAPGWIHTDFAVGSMAEDYYHARLQDIPLGRFGSPGDVAHAALFLASDEASYITGQVLNINGGLV